MTANSAKIMLMKLLLQMIAFLFLASDLQASYRLASIALIRCTQYKDYHDILQVLPLKPGSVAQFGGVKRGALQQALSMPGSVIVPHPVQLFKNFHTGMRLERSRDGRFLRGTSAFGYRTYFELLESSGGAASAKVVEETSAISRQFEDREAKLAGVLSKAEQRLANPPVPFAASTIGAYAKMLSRLQVNASGKKNDPTKFNYQNPDKAMGSLIEANRYALVKEGPWTIKDLEHLNGMILANSKEENILSGHLRDVESSASTFFMTETRFFEQDQHSDIRKLQVYEKMLDYRDVRVATQAVLDDINSKSQHSLSEILLYYKELMLIHPFMRGDSRTIRPLINKLLLQNGFDPIIKGRLKEYFLYYSPEEYLYFVLRQNTEA